MTVFSTIAMTGMKLIASQELTARNTTIVGLSAALGVGISQASEALSQFPEAATMIFGKSPVVIATLMAVLLNLILPKERGHSWKKNRGAQRAPRSFYQVLGTTLANTNQPRASRHAPVRFSRSCQSVRR